MLIQSPFPNLFRISLFSYPLFDDLESAIRRELP